MFAGNYRTQLYDKHKEEFLPATQGLGMFVEVKDPDEKVRYCTYNEGPTDVICFQAYADICFMNSK